MIELQDINGHKWVFNAAYIVAIEQRTDVLTVWLEEKNNYFEVDMASIEDAASVLEWFKSYLML